MHKNNDWEHFTLTTKIYGGAGLKHVQMHSSISNAINKKSAFDTMVKLMDFVEALICYGGVPLVPYRGGSEKDCFPKCFSERRVALRGHSA